MKISPAGTGLGAVASGDAPQMSPAPDIRRIKMNTNASPDRFETPQEGEVSAPSAINEAPKVEETKPISPQFAELARQRRALQVKERELADKEKQLATKHTSAVDVARIKSEPLRVLQEAGVTYDQLTEAIMANQNGINPEIQKLQAKIAELETGFDEKLTQRDTQAKQQVLAEMNREALQLASEGDDFEIIRTEKLVPEVIRLIDLTYEKEGRVMDVREAMQEVEDYRLSQIEASARLNKVQSRIAPPAPPQSQPNRQMRTLTNRDTARSVMSSRARAIAAFNGTLKK